MARKSYLITYSIITSILQFYKISWSIFWILIWICLFFIKWSSSLGPLIGAVPRKGGRLIVREEIAGLVCAEEIVFLHFHELGLIGFLGIPENGSGGVREVEAVDRGGGRAVEPEGRGRRRHKKVVVVVVLKNPRWRYGGIGAVVFVQDGAGVAIGGAIFHVREHWNSASSVAILETIVVAQVFGIRSTDACTHGCFALFHHLHLLIGFRNHQLFFNWKIALCLLFVQLWFQLSYLHSQNIENPPSNTTVYTHLLLHIRHFSFFRLLKNNFSKHFSPLFLSLFPLPKVGKTLWKLMQHSSNQRNTPYA